MAAIKSYTDIEQSKKLAEILPLESADMLFQLGEDKYADSIKVPLTKKRWEQMMPDINPCWSLAALLNALPNGIVMNKDSQNGRYHFSSTYVGTYVTAGNPVDACYNLVIKLNELKML